MTGVLDLSTVASVGGVVTIFLLVAYVLSRSVGRFNPVTLYPIYWAILLITPPVVGLGIYPPTGVALSIVALSVAAFAAGALVLGVRENDQPLERSPSYSSNLMVVLIVVMLMFFVGHATFRAGIEIATGMSFDDLDVRTIRYAQNYLEAGTGGALALFFSVGVVLVPLLLHAGARYSRLFYLPIVGVVGAIIQSPARTYGLTVAVVSITFFFYQSACASFRRRYRPSRVLAVGAVALAVSTAYFVTVGQSLGKGQSPQGVVGASLLPAGVDTTVLYFVGGLSALSVAVDAGFNPSVDAFGRSVSVVPRILSEIFPGVEVPETIAPPSFIPVPFNLYTAAGDVWFDFGWVGVFAIFFVMGVALRKAHDRALRGDLGAMFVAAYLVSTLMSTPLNLNLFTIQSMFLLGLGWLAFRSISWGLHPPGGSLQNGRRLLAGTLPLRVSLAAEVKAHPNSSQHPPRRLGQGRRHDDTSCSSPAASPNREPKPRTAGSSDHKTDRTRPGA